MRQEQPQERFMRRAFRLAVCGQGSASPNPVVGCVVVWQDLIIGEGFHHCYGQAHAEVNAIDSVLAPNAVVEALCRQTGRTPAQLLRESTAYVSLEPCSHYGKQPPCALKLIECGIPRVVVSCPDPNPAVNGKGVAMLREAGVEVVEHFLEPEGRELGRRFFTNVEKKRPYIILKWAQSEDGFLSEEKGRPTRITGPVMQVLNHSFRAQEDAVMVGTNTVLSDNPRLDARMYYGRQPARVTFDLHGRLLSRWRQTSGGQSERIPADLPEKLHFFDGELRTILFVNEVDREKYTELQAVLGQQLHIEAVRPPFPLVECMERLGCQRIGSLVVEGGSELLSSFIQAGLWDECRILSSCRKLGSGYPAPEPPHVPLVDERRYAGEWMRAYRRFETD